MRLLRERRIYPLFAALLLFATPIHQTGPSTILWTAPAIIVSAMMIAWAAESAQYFIAQGFALAILAWMQTLPEFAVEAVLAWKQQVALLLAGLTGALRLLTGFGWPVIYLAAAIAYRRKHGRFLRAIRLEPHHSVEVMGLLVPLIYIAVIAVKGVLTVFDAVILTLIYAVYLAILSRLPAQGHESIDELETIPRAIVTSSRAARTAWITLLFAGGAFLIYLAAEPFLASLLALSALAGIPNFVFIQWVAPVVSEFPEMVSTIYFARAVDRAPMALMNMVSSNINQWTLLMAMLPVLYSISIGAVSSIPFDPQQRLQLWLTLGQAVVGLAFLINMELAWWEAGALFVLFVIPFAAPATAKAVTVAYFALAALEFSRIITGHRKAVAFVQFVQTWKTLIAG